MTNLILIVFYILMGWIKFSLEVFSFAIMLRTEIANLQIPAFSWLSLQVRNPLAIERIQKWHTDRFCLL